MSGLIGWSLFYVFGGAITAFIYEYIRFVVKEYENEHGLPKIASGSQAKSLAVYCFVTWPFMLPLMTGAFIYFYVTCPRDCGSGQEDDSDG